jgi:hypothetical protein
LVAKAMKNNCSKKLDFINKIPYGEVGMFEGYFSILPLKIEI